MINTIQMAKAYQKRPSEILGIGYDYLAYMVDEFSLILENKVTDKNGSIHWSKVNVKGKEEKNNNDFIKHIESTRR